MFLCSLIEELCTKDENDKTGYNFNFGHDCITTKSCPHKCIHHYQNYTYLFFRKMAALKSIFTHAFHLEQDFLYTSDLTFVTKTLWRLKLNYAAFTH